ncbi:hypothetical protein NJ76_26060 [Rhodococcus sp. IITR03]|nr:hypothetical protein NJ76_26060 [Rhodococcus sp. IITR03]
MLGRGPGLGDGEQPGPEGTCVVTSKPVPTISVARAIRSDSATGTGVRSGTTSSTGSTCW